MKREPLESETLSSWANLYGVTLNGVKFTHSTTQGHGVFAEREHFHEEKKSLMTVSRDLLLSLETVHEHAKSDHDFGEVLTAADELSGTPRGAILLYLLMQLTIGAAGKGEVGVSGPWTEYVKYLSSVSLPSTWTEEEQVLLAGTSLEAALDAKMNRLVREFDHVQATTSSIGWCKRLWWSQGDAQLNLEDWVLVDSWYRSRALSFAQAGDAMVPCIDMMNHAVGEQHSAYFDRDAEGNVILLLPDIKTIRSGEEVTIRTKIDTGSYGDNKSAAEMLFSYGFINNGQETTSALTLELEIPHDDPLKMPKEAGSTAEAAVRIYRENGRVSWQSLFVWLACVNEEDGLYFRLAQTNNGSRELQIHFRDTEITHDTSVLMELLKQDPMWDVYQLRAISLLQDRVQTQLVLIRQRQANEQDEPASDHHHHHLVRPHIRLVASKLCALEAELLAQCDFWMDEQKKTLMESPTVRSYLNPGNQEPPEASDDVTFA